MTDDERTNRIAWLKKRIEMMSSVPFASDDVERMRAELKRLEEEHGRQRKLFE